MPGTFTCTLVTPEEEVFSRSVESVVVPAHDGKLGVLTLRSPLLTKLGYGRLTLASDSGSPESFFIAGGFAQMQDNHLTILTDESKPVGEITAAEAETLLDEATAEAAETTAEKEIRQKKIERARGMLTVANG